MLKFHYSELVYDLVYDYVLSRKKAYAELQCKCQTHYTDTGYGHVVQYHQRTSSQQIYNLLYNKFTTDGQHLDMSR